MRIPNPKAVTTTEAYLAYKAEVLEQSELKDKLYHPYLHIDGWLAYWTELTATYPTDKNGDPECLTDEEAYIAYLSGVTSEYPEALKDPADVRVASYLRYLISARFGRPDYPVTREEFYLSMMKPRYIPSGDPSSEIELDGTVEAPFVDVKMYGDTFQQTYTGKNLLPASGLTPETYTGGLTITPVYNTNDELMYILVNGTYTGETYFYYHIGDMSFEEGKTYTLSGSIGGSNSTYRIWVSAGTAFPLGNRLSSTNGAGTATASASQANGSVDIQIYPNATLDNVKFYPQIELSSTATSYEPYVGGTAFPNPDFPQDIDVVTGRQVVGVKGKNLLTGDYPSGANRGIAYSWDNVFATLSGTATSTYSDIVDSINMPLQEGTYTFSIDKPVQFRVNLRILYGGSSHDARIPAGDTSAIITIPSGTTDALLVRPYIDNITSGTVISETFGLMLETGSTATAFQPYYHPQSYEVNLGKNLFDKNKPFGFSTGNCSESVLDTGIRITQNSNSTGTNSRGVKIVLTDDYIGKTLTLSCHAKSSVTTNIYGIYLGTCDENYNNRVNKINQFYTASVSQEADITLSYAFTNEDRGKYIFINFYINNGASVSIQSGDYVDFTNIQLEVGSATPYATYFTPIELCKLGDYQDYIYRDEDGDWYVHKEINNVVAQGNSGAYNSGSNWYYVSLNAIGAPQSVYNGRIISTHFEESTTSYMGSSSHLQENGICAIYGSTHIVFRNTKYNATAGYQNWLSSVEPSFYYVLATPTDTQITNSELISQLDALMEGGSYEGKTYIKVTSTDPNLPGLLYVEAAI